MTDQPRAPRGTPDGGRFTPAHRSEAETHLEDEDAAAAVEAKAEYRLDQTVGDIHDCLADAERIRASGRERFEADPILRRAAKNVITELAEASGRLPQRWRDERPEVDWNAIRGMRNRIVHDYEYTDYDIVWDVITDDLPAMREHMDH